MRFTIIPRAPRELQNNNDTIQMFIDKADITKIQPRFVSKNDPTITPTRAMAIATGVDPESTSTTDMSLMMRKSIIRLMDSSLTTPLAKNLLRRSGMVDTFKVQYVPQEAVIPADASNPTIPQLLSGTKYSLEKYITDRMLFGYSMTLDEMQNKILPRHALELSYNMLKNMLLKGTYELESENPLHQTERRITIEKQWRFGSINKKDVSKPADDLKNYNPK